MWRLRCAALRAGHLFIRDTLESPIPSEEFHSSEPRPPWGHEDFVLARAVAEGVITGEQAELIGATRLEPEYTLAQAAADWGLSYDTLARVRVRAERRLVAWLREQAPHDDPDDRRERDAEVQAVHAATIIAAARQAARPAKTQPDKSHTVTDVGGKVVERKLRRVGAEAAAAGRTLRLGIRLHVITRDTAEQAWAEAARLLSALDPAVIESAQKDCRTAHPRDGSECLRCTEAAPTPSRCIRTCGPVGLVRGAGTALVGSHSEVTERIEEYHALGVDEFILSGHPHLEEAYWFGEGVLPILRRKGFRRHPDDSADGDIAATIPFAGAIP